MTDKEIEKEFGYEDMEEDWDDDLSEVIDIEEENDYYEDDDLDYGECDYEDELNVQETELPKGKKKYDSILDWDREDYWAYGCSAKKLLEMQFADMMSIAGLLEVVDSLILIGETQQHELQGNVSDISMGRKNSERIRMITLLWMRLTRLNLWGNHLRENLFMSDSV